MPNVISSSLTGDDVLTVSQLSLQVKDSLEGRFSSVCVSGEVSNLRRPRSGHIYLDLKDQAAVLHCVMWRNTAARLRFELEDGQQLLCDGGIDVYPPHGKYQLVIRQAEPLGEGALQIAFRQLHQRLQAEGLFDEIHKQPLPRYPQRIAMVTSATGAAVRDFLNVVGRRWRGAEVLVIPARVQGDTAAAEIAAGIAQANRLSVLPDVIVVGRGGGSIEDLWCFNEEVVVRAIFTSRVPVISAIGHEIDITLSDLAADVRAPTPSAAAELVVPDQSQLNEHLEQLKARSQHALTVRLQGMQQRLAAVQQHRVLRRPFDWLGELALRLDDLDQRSNVWMQNHLRTSEQRLATVAARLEALSPLAVLQRGYSLSMRADTKTVLRDTQGITAGELLVTRLASGEIVSRVEQVKPPTKSQ